MPLTRADFDSKLTSILTNLFIFLLNRDFFWVLLFNFGRNEISKRNRLLFNTYCTKQNHRINNIAMKPLLAAILKFHSFRYFFFA